MLGRNIRNRYDTAANFTASNRVLLAGERAIESDTLLEKVGNGSTVYNSLPYIGGGGGGGLSEAGFVLLADAVGMMRKLSTATIDTDVAIAQPLYEVPLNKFCVIAFIIVRNPTEADLSSLSGTLSFGFDDGVGLGAYNGTTGGAWFSSLYQSVVAWSTTASSSAGAMKPLGQPEGILGAIFGTPGANATLYVDVFGYLIDV